MNNELLFLYKELEVVYLRPSTKKFVHSSRLFWCKCIKIIKSCYCDVTKHPFFTRSTGFCNGTSLEYWCKHSIHIIWVVFLAYNGFSNSRCNGIFRKAKIIIKVLLSFLKCYIASKFYCVSECQLPNLVLRLSKSVIPVQNSQIEDFGMLQSQDQTLDF